MELYWIILPGDGSTRESCLQREQLEYKWELKFFKNEQWIGALLRVEYLWLPKIKKRFWNPDKGKASTTVCLFTTWSNSELPKPHGGISGDETRQGTSAGLEQLEVEKQRWGSRALKCSLQPPSEVTCWSPPEVWEKNLLLFTVIWSDSHIKQWVSYFSVDPVKLCSPVCRII